MQRKGDQCRIRTRTRNLALVFGNDAGFCFIDVSPVCILGILFLRSIFQFGLYVSSNDFYFSKVTCIDNQMSCTYLILLAFYEEQVNDD